MSFTNDPAALHRVIEFRDAATADGWSIEPTYLKHETVHRAASLKKDGFSMSILTQAMEPGRKWKYEASINIWGPDGLCIKAPKVYDWAAIQAGVQVCGYCGSEGVETQRVGFAGRSCDACLDSARKKDEYPGWCN